MIYVLFILAVLACRRHKWAFKQVPANEAWKNTVLKKARKRENKLGDLGSVQVVCVVIKRTDMHVSAIIFAFWFFVYLVHVSQPCFACAENNNNQNNCQSAANLEDVLLKEEYMSKIKY